jgi:hypothetical protein
MGGEWCYWGNVGSRETGVARISGGRVRATRREGEGSGYQGILRRQDRRNVTIFKIEKQTTGRTEMYFSGEVLVFGSNRA